MRGRCANKIIAYFVLIAIGYGKQGSAISKPKKWGALKDQSLIGEGKMRTKALVQKFFPNLR